MKPTLIIVDDLEEIREELRAVLEGEFDIVAMAADAKTATQLAYRYEPQLMLMDVVMPGMSGIEAAKIITDSLMPAPKIVMMSAITEETSVLAAREAGACDYLFKPVVDKRVRTALWEALKRISPLSTA